VNCWWCEKTQSCHEPESWFNQCGEQSAKRIDQCPIKEDKPSVYDPMWAKSLRAYSIAGYCSPGEVSNWDLTAECREETAGFVVDHTVQHHKTLAFGYVGHNDADKRIIVAFKGTNASEDWSTNLDVSWMGGTLYLNECAFGPKRANTHRGFCKYYRSLNDGSAEGGSLHEAIVKVHEEHLDYEVWFTGDSLGGAAATLQATLYGVLTGTKPRLMTFGEPRAGDAYFAKLVMEHTTRSVRITHANDPIPHVSPCCSWIGTAGCSFTAQCPYHHGTEVWYPGSMDTSKHGYQGYAQYHIGTATGEDPQGSNGLLGEHTNIPDHLDYMGMRSGACCF